VSEKVRGIISVFRLSWFGFSIILEDLCFTVDRVIVVRTGRTYVRSGAVAVYRASEKSEGLKGLSAEALLKTDVNNFVMLYSEIKKVELKKHLRGAKINLITNEKKYGWFVRGIPGEKSAKIEDYERILQPVFLEKFSVSR
jgi:hypothetical protein